MANLIVVNEPIADSAAVGTDSDSELRELAHYLDLLADWNPETNDYDNLTPFPERYSYPVVFTKFLLVYKERTQPHERLLEESNVVGEEDGRGRENVEEDKVSQNHQSDDDSSWEYSDDVAKEGVRPPREDGHTVSSYSESKDRIPLGYVRPSSFCKSSVLEFEVEVEKEKDLDIVIGGVGEVVVQYEPE